MSDIREANLEHVPERLPGVLWQAGPFLLLGGAVLWLRARWEELPARLPVHWNWRGDPDRFVSRNPLGAALPLLIGAILCLMMLGMQLGIHRGAPRAARRPRMLKVLLSGEYFSALICCGALASSVTAGRLLIPFLVVSFAGVLALLLAVFMIARRAPRTPLRNPSAWRAGFYVDKDDPALFVPKRHGVGYTFNFGNPMAIAFSIAILVLPLLAAALALSAR